MSENEAYVKWGVPALAAVLLGVVLAATRAPDWVAFVACIPLVAFGCWWMFVRSDAR